MQKEKNRLISFDILRIIAIFMVFYNHKYTYDIANNYNSFNLVYIIQATLSILCKCGPALFFMISGALLLGKEEKFSYIFKHRILRILIIMVICSFLVMRKDGYTYNFFTAFTQKCNWYLYQYLAYLIMLPFIRKIAINCTKNEMNLYLILSFIFYTFCSICIFFNYENLFFDKISIFNSIWASDCWTFIFTLTGFFIYKSINNENIKKYLLITSILALITLIYGLILCTYDIKLHSASNIECLRQHSIYPITCLIFILALIIDKYIKSSTIKKIIYICSSTTFGCFLLDTHTDLGVQMLFKIDTLLPSLNYYMKNIICIFCQFIIYNLIIYVLKKLPILKKLL